VLWRWRLGPLRLSRIPDLGGTWVGTVESDFPASDTRQAGELRIAQHWTRIYVQYLPTPASSISTSTMASLEVGGAPEPVLRYEYDSDPAPIAGSGLSPHRGTARLRLEADGHLRGDYYTGQGRKTVGAMDFARRSPRTSSRVGTVVDLQRPSVS
jgi:hypothetical protein